MLIGLFSCDAKYAEVFIEKGTKTNATITNLISRRERKVSGGSKMNCYVVEVNYFVKSKDKKTSDTPKKDYGLEALNRLAEDMEIGDYTLTEISITSKQYNQLQKGQKIDIYYLADEPEKAMLTEDVEKFIKE